MEKLGEFIPLRGGSGVRQDHSLSPKSANQTEGHLLRINFYIQDRPITRKVTTRSRIPICLDGFLPPFRTFSFTHICYAHFSA